MKGFALKILGLFVLTVVLLEIAVRVLGLSSDVNLKAMGEGDGYYLKALPGQSGNTVAGPQAEISAPYQINAQGQNWPVDYEMSYDRPLVAVVGGSMIESFFNPHENHIGYYLEEMNKDLKVHEYGSSGGMLHTSAGMVSSEPTVKNAEVVFIMHNVEKFYSDKFYKMIDPAPKYESFGYKCYINFRLFTYLNVNHKLLLPTMERKPLDMEAPKTGFDTAMEKIKSTYSGRVVFVINRSFHFEEGYQNLIKILKEKNIEYLDLTPALTKAKDAGIVLDFGFDQHFNAAGNKLVADEINKYYLSK